MPRSKKMNKENITPEKLRQFEGFEAVTDEEADAICAFTIQLASLVHEAQQQEKIKKEKSKTIKI